MSKQDLDARDGPGRGDQPAATPKGEADRSASSPFGGLTIDFGAGGGGAPLGMPVIDLGVEPPESVPAAGGPATATADPGRTESKLVIVGSGPAGLTAAIYAARANLEPIVLGGTTPGGQLMLTSDVENYPGFPEGIQGPELMALFRAQAERFGALVLDVDVDLVDLSGRPFRLWARGVEYRAQSVVVATGASAMWLGLESEARLRGRGVSACATCDGFFFRDREIGVVGGGDTAFEEATYLTRFASRIHLLHRRDTFRASKIMVDRARNHPKIEIHTNVAIDEVLGQEKVSGVRLRDTQTGDPSELPLDGLFIAIGHRPNTDAFRDWLDVDDKGYLIVRDKTNTKVEGVFVAGDVHDHRYRQAVTAAGDGCMAAIDAERWLESQGIAEASTLTAW
jgi:thioredoxin reductase (NADPH)